jgi:hypothetical protein
MQEKNVAPEEIALRAYRLWEERGCPSGSPQQDWLRAEAEMRSPSTQPVGVLLIPDRRWRTDAIKFLILRLNDLQRAFRYEFLPIPSGDLMIKRLRRRWTRVSRDDVRNDCLAFLQRYHDYAVRQCTDFGLADHTVPEKLILVSLARLSERRYIVSEPAVCILGLGD